MQLPEVPDTRQSHITNFGRTLEPHAGSLVSHVRMYTRECRTTLMILHDTHLAKS